jgi:hypothetical protein
VNSEFSQKFTKTYSKYFTYEEKKPVRPQSRYPRAPREPGFKLVKPQLHLTIGRYTSAYIRKPADDSDKENYCFSQY